MNIIVIGDIMVDINYDSVITRNAPEADIPIYNILDVNYILGGASNVAQNLNNLGACVEIISVVGDDIYGSQIKELFNTKKIKYKLFIDNERKTTQKNRIFTNGKLNARYDVETITEISFDIETQIIEYVTNKSSIDAIIISDYDKGVITDKLSQTLITHANNKNIPTFVDPKLKNFMKYKGCFLLKPNQNEAEIISCEKDINKILNSIKNKIECKNILLTRGKYGMVLNNCYNKIIHHECIKTVDVTGAGDVVLSVLVYVYLKNKNLFEAAKNANYIGGKSVAVIGNYTVCLTDINEYCEFSQKNKKNKIMYDYEVDKIVEISQNKNIVFTNGCFDILHSAHIELLQFAKSQGDLLVVGLNTDESIKRLKGKSRPINDINERAKILSLFDFVDYIILFKDDTPFNIINLLKPNILVKGADYNKDNIVGKDIVENIIFFNLIQNKSSTNIINRIKNI